MTTDAAGGVGVLQAVSRSAEGTGTVLTVSADRSVAELELSIISQLEPRPGDGLDDYDEVATHGTLEERMAAYDTGVA